MWGRGKEALQERSPSLLWGLGREKAWLACSGPHPPSFGLFGEQLIQGHSRHLGALDLVVISRVTLETTLQGHYTPTSSAVFSGHPQRLLINGDVEELSYTLRLTVSCYS